MSSLRSVAFTFAALLSTACVDEDLDRSLSLSDDETELAFRTTGTCTHCGGRNDGGLLNTQLLKGLPICNSLKVTPDVYHDFCALEGVYKRSEGGQVLEIVDLYVDGGILYGTGTDGSEYVGADFIDTEWHVLLDESGYHGAEPQPPVPWVMVVDSFIEDGHRSRYIFLNGPTAYQVEEPNCLLGEENDNDFTAILYSELDVGEDGTHFTQADTIYFGCTSGAMGKAGLWGYGPTETGPDAHQTATRMIRADYCGTGEAGTVGGTPLQLEDLYGKNSFEDSTEQTEAFWGPGGAACVDALRVTGMAPSCDVPKCEEGHNYENTGTTIWSKKTSASP